MFLAVNQQGNVERIRVYERSGQLALATQAFDDDEVQIRSAVTVHQALVLHEKISGLARSCLFDRQVSGQSLVETVLLRGKLDKADRRCSREAA